MTGRVRWVVVAIASLLSAIVIVMAVKHYWLDLAYRYVEKDYSNRVLRDFRASGKTALPKYEYYEKRWGFLPGEDIVVPDQLCGVCAVTAPDSFAHKFDCLHEKILLLDQPWPRPLARGPGAVTFTLRCTCDHPAHENRE